MRFLALLVLLVSFAVSAQSPNTDNPNLGFEAGTTENWTISNGTGGVKSDTSWNSNGTGVNTTTGITNYSPGGGYTWNITPYGNYMMTIQAGSGSPLFDNSMTSMGLNSTDITAIRNYLTSLGGNSNPTNASWAKREVMLQAGVTYTIAWQYLSTDYVPFNDGSIMTVVNNSDPNKLATLNNSVSRYALLGFTNPGTGNYATDSYGATGWQLATIVVPEDGNYILGFSSFNLGDTALSPILLVDDLQGQTFLNGQALDPIPPNEGSTAPSTSTTPSLCCGGSSAAFPIDPNHTQSIEQFKNRTTADSQVYIEQIGNSNTVLVEQTGTHNNYAEYNGNGSFNDITVTQQGNSATDANYIRFDVTGNGNSVEFAQQSIGGTKGIFASIYDNNNTVSVLQNGSGSHYVDLTLSGGNKNVDIQQYGSGDHQAAITLSGSGASSLSLIQQGTTAQSYSINSSCASNCQAISVIQGQ